MKRMINWLQTKLSRWGAEADEPGDDESVVQDTDESTGGADDSTRNEQAKTDGTMPDIYAETDVAPPPDRKFLDPSSPDADKTTGFIPYDTAKLHKK